MTDTLEATRQATRSQALFERAQERIPGGVNSPARACKAVDSDPIFIERADGSIMVDVDGNEYIDYVGSWGPMILGHRHPRVLEAIEEALMRGTSFGAPCRSEVELAELVCEFMPSIEMVRMVNSGTEATMSAIRLARAFTGRDMIIKFDGCYHGHADSFLVKAGSGLATLGLASSPGVPAELLKMTISLPFNNLDEVRKAFDENKDAIAAVIVEPVVGNAGVILPAKGFLEGLADLCREHGCLLIFDEVMTGFRVARGGAQELYEIKPDLTCLGKVIGAGLPVGAYGGRKEIMEMVAPRGEVYQAGTLSGNPLAMSGGLAQLRVLKDRRNYDRLKDMTDRLVEGIKKGASDAGVHVSIASVCGMLSVFFMKGEVTDFESAKKSDTELFTRVWKMLLEKGVYWPPSQFEAAFLSLMHTPADLEKTIRAFAETLDEVG